MPTLTFSFYDVDPFSIFSRTVGNTSTYTGPADATGIATITDNAGGAAGTALDDDNAGGETATADVSLNGDTSIGSNVDAERVWTLRDTVTGEVFEVVSFDVENGAAAGDYLLSERPLVPGRSYETLAYDSNPNVGAGDPAFTYADYSDGIVEGTDGDDVIDADYTGDPGADVVDGNDAPGTGQAAPEELNWTDYADNTNLAGGVTQDTGNIDVTMSFNAPAGSTLRAEHSNPLYVEGGEPFNPNSGLRLFQNGNAQDATLTFDFAADAGTGFEDAVSDVSFRISDIDGMNTGGNNFQDIITITAFGPDGNEVPVTITSDGTVTIDGNTITGAMANTSEGAQAGSALIEIPGPVSQIVINYDNGGTTQQAIFLTDLHFDAIPEGSNDDVIEAGAGNDIVDAGAGDDEVYGEAGDDTLTGGQGDDLLDGGTGDDTLNVGSGDTALGGDGDDTFIIDQSQLSGGTIDVTGGEGDEVAGDTLDLTDVLVKGSIVYSNTDDNAGGLSGTATLIDGTVVNFSEIETIICFASGTLIDTPFGPRAIETLAPGDLVLTADRGPRPIRWHGRRSVAAEGRFAPVRIQAGAFGNTRDLVVSPQHRLLIRDHRAPLYFGEDEVLVAAKALTGAPGVETLEGGEITYHHLLFDTHEIVFANDMPSESYHPGAYSLDGIGAASRAELFALFPALRSDPKGYGPAARPAIRAAQASVLAA